MSDYIKREDALEIVNNNLSRFMIALRIGDCPSADVVPVRHGLWIEDEVQIHVEKTYHCSECDCLAWGEDEKTRYCPTCGARMDGEVIKNE